MSSSLDHALSALKTWQSGKRTVAVFSTAGPRVIGNGSVAEVTGSAVRIGTSGFAIEIALDSAQLDWREGNEIFEPLLRIRTAEFDCVLFPLKEVPTM